MASETIPMPEAPAGLWMLWAPADEHGDGCWVRSVDDPSKFGGESYLVCTSEADARATAEHQAELYDIDCVPVRVK